MIELFDRARRGEADALGVLLERYRGELRRAAGALLGPALRTRIDPSDLVQETFFKAAREFARFEANHEGELRALLRTILVHCLTDQIRYHSRKARSYRRQVPLDAPGPGSPSTVQRSLAAREPSPSEGAVRREQTVLLADAVTRLSDDRREVYELRTLHHLSFEEVASRMNRSDGAVRMLWTRAVEELSDTLREKGRA